MNSIQMRETPTTLRLYIRDIPTWADLVHTVTLRLSALRIVWYFIPIVGIKHRALVELIALYSWCSWISHSSDSEPVIKTLETLGLYEYTHLTYSDQKQETSMYTTRITRLYRQC